MSRITKALLAVLACIVLAAIIIPNLIRSRLPSGGPSAIGGVRTIQTAEAYYASTYPNIGFSASLAALGGSSSGQPTEEQAGLVDSNLASGIKSGYRYTYAPVWDAKTHTNIGYTVHADPIPKPPKPPPTWLERVFHSQPKKIQPELHFFSDQTGVMTYEIGKEASAASTAL